MPLLKYPLAHEHDGESHRTQAKKDPSLSFCLSFRSADLLFMCCILFEFVLFSCLSFYLSFMSADLSCGCVLIVCKLFILFLVVVFELLFEC